MKEGLARESLTRDEAYTLAENGIRESRDLVHMMLKENFIKTPPQEMLQSAFDWAVEQVK